MPTKKTTPKPETVRPARTPQSTVPESRTVLNDLQLMLCDELADIISNGSEATAPAALLLTAVAHHREFRRNGKNWERDRVSISNPADWRIDLESIWKARRSQTPSVEPAATQTAKDRLRTCVLDNMKAYFRRFICQSTPEERDLLLHALELHYSAALPDDFEECHLATILDEEINGRQSTYLRVPERLRDAMESHLKLLTRAAKCEAA